MYNYFAYELYGALGRLYDPFDDLSDTITPTSLDMTHFIRRYETYVQQHRQRLFQHAPRRLTDGRIYEAVYHFNLYMYLTQFLATYEASVIPEFPTGNGQVDLFIQYAGTTYGIEVKSFISRTAYEQALTQVVRYGQQLGLTHMWLIFFVEAVSAEHRRTFEATYVDAATGVTVQPLLVVTG